MKKMSHKVAVIGAGNVGLGTALSILFQNVADELVLIDRNEYKAEGEVWDMANAVAYLDGRTKVKLGKYSDVKDADVICIAASAAPPAGGDRLAELELSSKIVRSIVRESMDNGFDGIFIIQTNPVDIMTMHALDESKLPAHRVIGTGTSLDTARLRQVIAEICDNVDIRSVNGYVMGEHGNSQAIVWSSINAGGKSFLQLREENPEKYAKQTLDEIKHTIVNMAWDIIDRKGNTAYGIGSAATRIIKAIFHDEKAILPVSALLNGEYGQCGIMASVPAIVGQNGVEKIVEIDMTEEEKADVKRSMDLIKTHSPSLSK